MPMGRQQESLGLASALSVPVIAFSELSFLSLIYRQILVRAGPVRRRQFGLTVPADFNPVGERHRE
jgi:hypothetical protein